MRDDPELDIIRKRGFQHEARYLADLRAAGRDGRRDRDRTARSTDRGEELRAAAAATIEAMAAGADVIYQATFFDGTLARPRRLPAPRRRAGPSVALGAVPLRGRRHQARPPRQGQRDPPDLLVRRPARADPGRPARVAPRRARRQRPDRRAAPRRRLHGLLPQRPRPIPRDAGGRDAGDVPAGRRPTRSRSSTATSAAGRPNASTRRRDRRPPEPRRRDQRPPATGPDRPRRRDARGARRPAPADGAAARGHRRGRARPGPRAGADPARGPARRAASSTSCSCPTRAADRARSAAWRRCRAPSPGDLFFDIEGDPYAFDDGLDYLFGVLDTDGTFHAIWSRDEAGEFSPRRRTARLRAPHRLHHRAPRRATRRCTSTTTRRTSRPRSSG